MPRPDLFSELKRRKVYRVGAAYLAVVFGGLQGADLVFPALGLGPRAFNGLVLASLLGFPAVVALAWMFDITAQGVRRTGPADEPSGDLPAGWASDRWARVKLVLVGAGFMGLAWFGVHLWQVPSATPHTEVMPGPRPVLAVLPFEDMSPGGDQAYFVDGLHEELLHQLAVLKGIELRSRTSVEHFRGSPSDVSAIADSLGAGYVLEGSVRRAPDSVRVTAQLIDGTTDQHLWSESFSRPLSVEGIFALQQELATRLARSLGATLASGEVRSLGPPPTRSADAYNAYLLGIYHSRVGGGTDALLTALDDFRRATTLDPGFGRAWGRLGLAAILAHNGGAMDRDEAFTLARAAATRAVELAPDEPESHLAWLAVHWTLEWNWDAAREDLEAVLALNPDLVDAHLYMAEYWSEIAGDTDRALRELDAAMRLDPLAVGPRLLRANYLSMGRRFEEGLEARRAFDRDFPDEPSALPGLAGNLAFMGHRQESEALDSLWLPLVPRPLDPSWAITFAWRGDTVRARAILDTALVALEEGRKLSPQGFAYAYLGLGQYDEALDWLERAADESHYWLLRDPAFDPLVPDPRFQALWKRVGLKGEPKAGRQPARPAG